MEKLSSTKLVPGAKKVGGRCPKAKEIKGKISKWDLNRLKSFCTAKETTDIMKRQPNEWEKIYANHMSDKWLVSKIYKQLIQLNIKKQIIQSKMGRRLEQTFFQRRHADRWLTGT